MVYKASLQWNLDATTEVVAVKTLKGLFFYPFKCCWHIFAPRKFQLLASLQAMSLGDMFCISRKGGTGGGGGCTRRVQNSMVVSQLGCRMAVVGTAVLG